MRKITFLLACILGAGLSACENADDEMYPDNGVKGGLQESRIYRQRDPNYPLILSQPRERPVATRSTELQFDDILGRSFKVDNFPFESMQNVGLPVIDLKKLEADKPAWSTKIALRQSTSTAFSYSTFDRYEENSSTTKKVNSGFQLNLGIFKIGNKSNYYSHFASSLLTSSNSVFGQLDIEIKDAVYNLAVNTNRLNQIRKDYLVKDFTDDLYNLHPDEFISFYGPFVMTNFVTGGRAAALFAGTTKTTTTTEAREKSMDSEISASFALKKDQSGSLSLGFGKGFTNGSSSTNTFTQLQSTLMTLGGTYGLGAFTTPKSIDNMNIDLTAWANSINTTSNHSLVDIQNGGLVPLSGFFIEANLKAQYERYVAGEELPVKGFVEPKLVHELIVIHEQDMIDSFMFLVTRFNDVIQIRVDKVPFYDIQSRKELFVIFDELCDSYKIKAEQGSVVMMGDIYNSIINIAEKSTFNGTFYEGLFFEPQMKRYFDSKHEMLYLLYNENGKKVGYSIYVGNGDYLLDTYAMRHWVEKLPETTVSDNELLNYRLIAL